MLLPFPPHSTLEELRQCWHPRFTNGLEAQTDFSLSDGKYMTEQTLMLPSLTP